MNHLKVLSLLFVGSFALKHVSAHFFDTKMYALLQKVLMFDRALYRNNHRRCSVKKGFLKSFANFTGKHLCWRLFLIKLQAWRPKICEIFKNAHFEEHPRTAASAYFGPCCNRKTRITVRTCATFLKKLMF